MKNASWCILLSWFAIACASGPIRQAPACTLEQSFARSDDLRGDRYCEILLVQGTGNDISGCVYNTIGLSDCPAEAWEQLDARKLRREFGASALILNGPRYFVMDGNAITTASQETVDFDGVQMRPIAAIVLPPGSVIGAHQQTPYTETTVTRDTEYVYLANRPVYELRTPEGVVYIMQAYSQIVDPNLTADDLPGLASRLKLPDGWTYTMRVPKTDLTIRSGGTAHVLQDELQNTYQRVE
jgi:haloalkane dehalogenase